MASGEKFTCDVMNDSPMSCVAYYPYLHTCSICCCCFLDLHFYAADQKKKRKTKKKKKRRRKKVAFYLHHPADLALLWRRLQAYPTWPSTCLTVASVRALGLQFLPLFSAEARMFLSSSSPPPLYCPWQSTSLFSQNSSERPLAKGKKKKVASRLSRWEFELWIA